jgi:hypothetical protein
MLSRLLPFLVSLVFWRRKPRQNVSAAANASTPDTEQGVKESDASRSREILKVLKLEREIIGTALTTIYESEAQGIITREERDRLLDKYSSDLKELESRISEHQRIVDIFDLESAKKELLLSFREKLSEIDKKLTDLRGGIVPFSSPITETRSDQAVTSTETVSPTAQSGLNTKTTELQDVKAKTEKKIEAIREEVLKAMERLEQIESEG